MHDLAVLLLVLGGFYVYDCALWLQAGTVLFRPRWDGTWRPTQPHPLVQRAGAGLVLPLRLPPLAPLHLAAPWPLALSPTHVAVPAGGDDEAGPGTRFAAVAYAAIGAIERDERRIQVNKRPCVRASSPSVARDLVALVQTLAPLSELARDRAIRDAIRKTLDVEAARANLQAAHAQAWLLRLLCNLLFAYLFVGLPYALVAVSLASEWPWILAGLVTFTLVIAVEYWDVHAWLRPEEGSERRQTILHFCLYPPAALRASDLVLQRLGEPYHPLAVAGALADSTDFATFARQTLRELHYPTTASGSPEALAAAAWFRSALVTEVASCLTTYGLTVEELLRPPARSDAASQSYCPRCETRYTSLYGQCADCPGVTLHAFPPAMEPTRMPTEHEVVA